ncbi:MAG: FKBP-type peptidyl-prolyl cis-trans isomerase [Deltaproteobacteria bacterium]
MRSRWILWGVSALLLAAGCRRNQAAEAPAQAQATPMTEQERTFYALGYMTGDRLHDLTMSPREVALIARGLSDAVLNAGRLADPDEYASRIRDLQRARRIARMSGTRQTGARLLEQTSNEPGATVLPSGAVVRELHAGTGRYPGLMEFVTVNYRGTLANGVEFDSSDANHGPVTFLVNNVLPCVAQALQHVHVGARARIVCPPESAYAENPRRTVPPDSTLIFEVDVLSVSADAPSAPDGGTGAAPAVPPMLRPEAP